MYLARPQRTPNPNLSCPLCNAGQHDVHDDDAAHHQEYADQADGDARELACQIVPQLHDRIGAQNGKIVRGVIRQVAPGAHQHACFVLARAHHLRAARLHEYTHPVARTMQLFFKGVQRHDHEIVLRLPEGAADALRDSYDLILMRFRAHQFPHRIDIGEKPVRHVRADEYDFPAMVVVGLVNKAALHDVDVAHLRIVRGNTHDVGVLQARVPGAHLDVVVVARGNRFGRFHAMAHALVIFHGNQRTLLRFDPRVLTGDDAEAIHNEHVCAEVGYAVGNVKVHPGDHAHHRHKGGYGQNYAQQGEEAAQLVS